MIFITQATFPHLHKACQEIGLDSGLSNVPHAIGVPFGFETASAANLALGTLSAEDLEEFCIGEESNQLAIRARHPGLELAWQILNWYFDNMA